MKDTLFKVLRFTDDRDKILGNYAAVIKGDDELYGCRTPQLMTMKATLKGLQNLYPSINFKNTKMVTVKVVEIETNNT